MNTTQPLKLTALALVCTTVPALAGETVLQVPQQFPTIQAAIDAALPGDTVEVGPGVWTGVGNRDLSLGAKDLVVRSAQGPATCIIDCNGTVEKPHRAFLIDGGQSRAAVVQGFTIVNGTTLPGAIADEFNGGAIQILDSSPTISGCVFRDNFAGCWGAAVYSAYSGSPLITGCTFDSNHADDDGGGFFTWAGAEPVLVSCAFVDNSARVSGGAVAGFGGGTLTIANATMVGNDAPNGAAVISFDTTSIVNSIVWGNTGDDQQIYEFTGGAGLTVDHCVVMGGFPGIGNVDVDPQLEPDGTHLSSTSPCIDAGIFLTGELRQRDIDGERRRMGRGTDLGADEVHYRTREADRSAAPQQPSAPKHP